MLRLLRQMMGRMGLTGAVVMALAFTTPALAAHLCVDQGCAPAGQTAFEMPSDGGEACADCGPACANGCCHVQHAAIAPELSAPSSPVFTPRAEVWLQDASPPVSQPAGPDRPPRY